tara:strand:+ start:501 stop:680 length:180 start_codon:yes stop_codon:yes gene_type:complete
MIPKTLKGRTFVFLTFVNLTLASFFAAAEAEEQLIVSALTAVMCMAVWIFELPANNERD